MQEVKKIKLKPNVNNQTAAGNCFHGQAGREYDVDRFDNSQPWSKKFWIQIGGESKPVPVGYCEIIK